jgi:hypothetical protein
MNMSSAMSLVRHPSGPRLTGKSIPSAHNSKVRAFLALSDIINTSNDDHAILRQVLAGLSSIVGARAGLLMASTEYLCSEYRHPSDRLLQFERALRQRDEKILSLFAIEGVQRFNYADGLLLVPLLWRQNTIGLFAFDLDGKKLVPSDKLILHSLSNQVAAVFGPKIESSKRLSGVMVGQMDIGNAVAVQQSLLPTIPPERTCGLSIATHTLAADHIGGDYFDLILVDQKKMGIVIADVEGKGVSAALFSNMLRSTVHFLTRETPSTSAVVGKINSILHKEAAALRKLFTLFYAVYDPTEKILQYTGSGHVPPILIRAKGKEAERLRSDGTPIGIRPVQHLSERSVRLSTGDVVAFFTDGLSEHLNETGHVFSEQRVVRILQENKSEPVETIMNRLLAELSRFSSRQPLDDVTIILAKVLNQQS